MKVTDFILPAVIAFVLTAIGLLIFIRLTRKRRAETHSQKPLIGGIGIFCTLLCIFVFMWTSTLSTAPQTPAINTLQAAILVQQVPAGSASLLFLMGGAAIMFLLGVVDDNRRGGLHFLPKFFVQICTAILFLIAETPEHISWESAVGFGFALFWIVGITNAFNLLDNMDGLTAGVAAVACIFLLLMSVGLGQLHYALVLALFIGALAGFLLFNMYPAKIYMGDAGSLFTGFLIAGISWRLGTLDIFQPAQAIHKFIPIMLILAVPVVDTLSVIIIRSWQQRSLFIGDKSHLSHQLVHLGLSQRQSVLLLQAAACFSGLAALSFFTP